MKSKFYQLGIPDAIPSYHTHQHEFDFDLTAGVLNFSGSSGGYYDPKKLHPVRDWLYEFFYLSEQEVTANFRIEMMNNITYNFISEIMGMLGDYATTKNFAVTVNWYYYDVIIGDIGEEHQEDYPDLVFNLIEIPNPNE